MFGFKNKTVMLKTKGINQNPDFIGITPIEIGATYNFCCTPPCLQNLSPTKFQIINDIYY